MTTSFAVSYNAFNRALLGLLGMGPRHSGIDVGDETVEVRMGWSFRAVIDRSAIVSVEPDHDRVWGWGVHGWRDRWLVNGSSTGIVRITIDPPVPARMAFVPLHVRTLRVSAEDPEAVIAAIRPLPA